MSKTLREIAAEEIAAKKEAESREAEAQSAREAAAAYQAAWQRFVDACSLHWSDDEAGQAIAALAGMLRQRDLRSRLEEAAEQHKSHRRKSFLVELLIGAYDGKADGAQLNAAREWDLDPHIGLSDEADSVREGIMLGFSPPPKPEEKEKKKAQATVQADDPEQMASIQGGAATEPESAESAKSVDETLGRLLHLVGDGDAIKILSVARDQSKSANDRMYGIIKMDRRFDGYDSVKWGELLDVTADAVRQTEFWKTRKQRRERQ